jgi:hypothetical protein
MHGYSIQIPQVGMGSARLGIDSFPWQAPDAFRPKTVVALEQTGDSLLVFFRVEDQFVLARTQEFDGPVYEDSCVEFFFTPSPEPGPYFNIEVNAAGGLKFNRQTARGVDRISLPESVRGEINLHVSPGKIIVPEFAGPLDWEVSYEIPFALLEHYGPVNRTEWRGNFYKCAEANSHPHFGSWAPIGTPNPDFHRPEFFGCLLLCV